MAAANPTSAATNRLGIRYVTTGAPGLRARLNEIIRALDYLYPSPTTDIVTTVTPDGALPKFRTPPGLGARSVNAPAPFAIFAVAELDTVTVWPGDVENIIPTIGGTLINAATPPQLTVVTGSVYLECTMDAAGALTAAEIKNAASLPADTSTLRYRQLGTVTVNSGPPIVTTVTAQTVTTSVSHKLCGGLSTWGQA